MYNILLLVGVCEACNP